MFHYKMEHNAHTHNRTFDEITLNHDQDEKSKGDDSHLSICDTFAC
jgi:hypothetical protein